MSEKKWYVYIDSVHTGPFEWSEVVSMHGANKIDEHTLAWHEGQEDWLPIGELDPRLKTAGLADRSDNEETPEIPTGVSPYILSETNIQAVEEAAESSPPEVPFEQEVDTLVSSLGKEGVELQVEKKEEELLDDEEKEFLSNWHVEQVGGDVPVVEDQSLPDSKLQELVEETRAQEEGSEQIDLRQEQSLSGVTSPTIESEMPVGVTQESSLGKKSKIVMGVAVALVIFVMANSIFSDKKMIPSLRALKSAEAKRLMRAVNSKLAVKVEVSPSDDGREIWFASNHKGPGIFHIKLSSIAGRVMSDEVIEVVGKTEFNNYVGVFRFLKLRKGVKVVPGEYKLEGQLILTGRKARLFKYLKESSLFSSLVENSKTSFEVRQDIRISKFQGEQFENQLKEYHDNKKLNKLKPLMERIQKFRTLITLAEDIISLYKSELKLISEGKAIRQFEIKYSKQMAPILQGLILENHKISVGLADKESEEYADYANLLSFGRQLGGIVSDMVTRTGMKPKITVKGRQRLINQFTKETQKLIGHGRDYMTNIQKRVEQLD